MFHFEHEAPRRFVGQVLLNLLEWLPPRAAMD